MLEVGGGIGSLQIELLEAGASHATNVEIIDSYEATARSLIAEHGLEARVERHIADYAQHPDHTPAADIVIMHRVICCYPDPDTLTSAACSRARDRVAITIPRETRWVKLGFRSMNAWLRLRRIAFRGYVHPHADTRRRGLPRLPRHPPRTWPALGEPHPPARIIISSSSSSGRCRSPLAQRSRTHPAFPDTSWSAPSVRTALATARPLTAATRARTARRPSSQILTR